MKKFILTISSLISSGLIASHIEVYLRPEPTAKDKSVAEDQLLTAAIEGDLKKINQALDSGADINATSLFKNTALMHAAEIGYTDIVSKLIARGANINAKEITGMTAIMKAAENDHDDIVTLLLAKGAEIPSDISGYSDKINTIFQKEQSKMRKLSSLALQMLPLKQTRKTKNLR